MNVPLELDAIVVTVGEQIESPEQEADMIGDTKKMNLC